MDNRKAIDELKGYADSSWGSLGESFKLAIEALEKQIPKKPVYCTVEYKNMLVCPNCKGREIMLDDYDYCPICGQAIE